MFPKCNVCFRLLLWHGSRSFIFAVQMIKFVLKIIANVYEWKTKPELISSGLSLTRIDAPPVAANNIDSKRPHSQQSIILCSSSSSRQVMYPKHIITCELTQKCNQCKWNLLRPGGERTTAWARASSTDCSARPIRSLPPRDRIRYRASHWRHAMNIPLILSHLVATACGQVQN
jgi:hypothetical protein